MAGWANSEGAGRGQARDWMGVRGRAVVAATKRGIMAVWWCAGVGWCVVVMPSCLGVAGDGGEVIDDFFQSLMQVRPSWPDSQRGRESGLGSMGER